MCSVIIPDKCYSLIRDVDTLQANRNMLFAYMQNWWKNNMLTAPSYTVPLLLRGMLLRLPQIESAEKVNAYLTRMRQVLSNAKLLDTAGAQEYYWLNCCLLLINLDGMEEQNKLKYRMYAYCLLCFDYTKLNRRLI